MSGVVLAASGFTMGPVRAPAGIEEQGELAFRILDGGGNAVRRFEAAHGKDLHLIVVRSDGSHYSHVHPVLDPDSGTWSLPWTWGAAGTYRVYADFTAAGAAGVTLSRTVDVAGVVEPSPATLTVASDTVDGFHVVANGELIVGVASHLTFEVTRAGSPTVALEPYLGAFGHLVALRDGDLAYLHVHALGDEPNPGDVSDPQLTFAAHAPTPGRYMLYLDFQVAGRVQTARFVLDAVLQPSAGETPNHRHMGGGHKGPHQ